MKQHVITLVIAIMACLTSFGCQQQNESILSQEEVDLINYQSNLVHETNLNAMAMAHEKEMNSTAPYSLRLDPDGQLFLIVGKPNLKVYWVDIANNRLVLQ